jgi:serine/threonine-protein kinase
LHEARAAARIRHRNVVDVYDVVTEGSSVFLVMELLEGEQLSVRLASHELMLPDLIRLLLPAMAGVAAAHAAHVVHRDIKPDNIFLAREDGTNEMVPKIIDFGISRVFEADGSRLTRSGMTMGTPKYVSYEQLRGARDVDGRADVYAFGVILYEAITGAPPYEASTLGEQAISFVTTEPSAPNVLCPDLPARLSEIVLRAIHRERELRSQSMDALIHELEPYAHAAVYAVPIKAKPLKAATQPKPHAAYDLTTAPQGDAPHREAQQEARPVSLARLSPAPSRKSARRSRYLVMSVLGAGALVATVVGLSPATPKNLQASPRGHTSSEERAPVTASPTPPVPVAPNSLSASSEPASAADAQPVSDASVKRPGPVATRSSGPRWAVAERPAPAPEPRVELPRSPTELEVVSDDGPRHSPPAESVHRAGGLRREEF